MNSLVSATARAAARPLAKGARGFKTSKPVRGNYGIGGKYDHPHGKVFEGEWDMRQVGGIIGGVVVGGFGAIMYSVYHQQVKQGFIKSRWYAAKWSDKDFLPIPNDELLEK